MKYRKRKQLSESEVRIKLNKEWPGFVSRPLVFLISGWRLSISSETRGAREWVTLPVWRKTLCNLVLMSCLVCDLNKFSVISYMECAREKKIRVCLKLYIRLRNLTKLSHITSRRVKESCQWGQLYEFDWWITIIHRAGFRIQFHHHVL